MYTAALLFISAAVTLAAPLCGPPGNDTVQLQLSTSSISGLQLSLFLENLELAFFQSGIMNITAGDSRYGQNFNQTVADAALVKIPGSHCKQCLTVFKARKGPSKSNPEHSVRRGSRDHPSMSI